MAPMLFRLLLVAVILYALLRGGRDERIVALLCLAGVIGTELLLPPPDQRFAGMELGVMAVDLVLLAGFIAVALRSIRFWPLWVAGLQLTAAMSHLLKSIDTNLLPHAYGAALTFWSYPILLILAVGTWRHYRRRRADQPVPG